MERADRDQSVQGWWDPGWCNPDWPDGYTGLAPIRWEMHDPQQAARQRLIAVIAVLGVVIVILLAVLAVTWNGRG